MEWQVQETPFAVDGLINWELREAAVGTRNSQELWLPVFVNLNWEKQTGRLVEFLKFVDQTPEIYALAADERSYLQTVMEQAETAPDAVTAVIYCRPNAIESPLWTVQLVGPPVNLSKQQLTAGKVATFPKTNGLVAKRPIVAVLDDAIGFLNMQFRKDLTHTRFLAMLIQTADAPASNGWTQPPAGVVLEAADIEQLLQSGMDEATIYAAVNAAIFGPDVQRGTNHHTGHGTHVLDLAAGAPPGSTTSEVALLAVQLPPTALGETSGRRLDPAIAFGLRWVINRALMAAADPAYSGAAVPLIVNISLGALGGPQDGTSPLEQVITSELARYRSLAPNASIHIVAAYGNAYRARLVANASLDAGEAVTLDWRLLPDDWTPSYLELRVPKGWAPAIAVHLVPPITVPTKDLFGFPSVATPIMCINAGAVVATITTVNEANFDVLQFAVAPTMRDDPGGIAPEGLWQLTITNMAKHAVEVSAKVLRDDTPQGYRRRGRQSWIDHMSGWDWDEGTMEWAAPAAACPVTRAGTEVSFGGVNDPSMFFIAAVTPDFVADPSFRPARYSSAGLMPARVPTYATVADEGSVVTGLRASGVVTGSTARLSGTSVAAPVAARLFLKQILAAATPPLKYPVAKNARTGTGILAG